MDDCKICGAWLGLMLFPEKHVCPPKWEIWDEDNWGDEYKIYYGIDAEDVGEKYAEAYNRDDDPLADDGTHEVKIRKLGETEWTAFVLSAELVYNYHARKVEDKEGGDDGL